MRKLLVLNMALRATALACLAVLVTGCVSDDPGWGMNDRPYGGSNLHALRVAHGKAVVPRCGDWSEDLADSSSLTMNPDHGCAVQANQAAMISDANEISAKPKLGKRNSILDIDAIRSSQSSQSRRF